MVLLEPHGHGRMDYLLGKVRTMSESAVPGTPLSTFKSGDHWAFRKYHARPLLFDRDREGRKLDDNSDRMYRAELSLNLQLMYGRNLLMTSGAHMGLGTAGCRN